MLTGYFESESTSEICSHVYIYLCGLIYGTHLIRKADVRSPVPAASVGSRPKILLLLFIELVTKNGISN